MRAFVIECVDRGISTIGGYLRCQRSLTAKSKEEAMKKAESLGWRKPYITSGLVCRECSDAIDRGRSDG